MKLIKTFTSVAAAGLLCSLPQVSFGALVADPAGGVIGAIAISGASAPVGGVLGFSTGPVAFATPSWTGTLTSAAYLQAGGTYTFVETIQMLTGNHDISRLVLNGFAGFPVNVGNLAAGGTAPLTATVTASSADNVNVTGDSIGFNFDLNFNLLPGAQIVQVVIETTARSFSGATANIIDGSTVNTISLAPVPEPTTVIAGALLLLPLGASAIRILRRNRTA